ncbi:15489_t:CDS:2 [Entrophospora sp. SA101]|nr:15489_t:CDS:2 [Entrophospora sp. SA101]
MEPPPIPFKFAPEQTGMNFTTMPIPPTQTQGFPQTSSASNNSNLQPLTNLETSIPPIPSLNNPQHPLYQQNPHFPPSLQQIPVTTNSPDLNSRDSIISNASTSQFYNVAQNQQQVPPILSSQPQQQPDLLRDERFGIDGIFVNSSKFTTSNPRAHTIQSVDLKKLIEYDSEAT